MRVVVVGSVNLDLVARVARLPAGGDTVSATGYSRVPGGKGANQALAARRLGAEVTLVAAVGTDDAADEALALLAADGVDLAAVRRVDSASTGTALITVDDDGENTIVVVPGANAGLRVTAAELAGADAVLCQLEVPMDTVAAAAAGGPAGRPVLPEHRAGRRRCRPRCWTGPTWWWPTGRVRAGARAGPGPAGRG